MDIYEEVKKFYESVATQKRVIGRSVCGRELFAVKIGEGRPTGIVQYAIHGREYPTAYLAFEHDQAGVSKGSCWLVPLLNPDGALLAEKGLASLEREEDRARLLALNGGSSDFSLWKANARGVDLNVNFPARWGEGKRNTRTAGSENYIGEYPLSEPESKALQVFTQQIRPDYTVSYHTKGEEIYWYFYQSLYACTKDKRLASVLSRSTGYPLAYAKNSAGGYKDWCIQRLKIPAFTVEAGGENYPHPLPKEGIEDMLRKNRRAIYDLSKEFL